MEYVVTYFPEFRKSAEKEVKEAGGTIVRRLGENMSVADGLERLVESDPVFVRHMFPVNGTGYVPDGKDEALRVILEMVEGYSIGRGEEFAVQCRIVEGGRDYKAKDVEVFVGTHFDELGCVPVFSDYGLNDAGNIWIISVLIVGNEVFCGLSKANQNLNFHCDEYRVLSRGGGREISRAENKLKEAICKFGIKTGGKYALDIGAAPGGWSKVLADYGYIVFAVDPGELHPSLIGNEKIRHFKSKIEALTFNEKFDIVVNDMNVDPQQTAEMMNGLAHNVPSGAYAVVTLKLPFADVDRSISEATEIMNENYSLLTIKNLTHNRREVTALLRRL